MRFRDPKGTCPTKDCLQVFWDCMAYTLGDILDIATGIGAAGSSYYEASAYQHAAARNLTYPLRSSIFRGLLEASSRVPVYGALGAIIIAEGICLKAEIDCLNEQ